VASRRRFPTDREHSIGKSYLRAKSFICRAWVSLRRRAGFTGADRVIQKVRRYQIVSIEV